MDIRDLAVNILGFGYWCRPPTHAWECRPPTRVCDHPTDCPWPMTMGGYAKCKPPTPCQAPTECPNAWTESEPRPYGCRVTPCQAPSCPDQWTGMVTPPHGCKPTVCRPPTGECPNQWTDFRACPWPMTLPACLGPSHVLAGAHMIGDLESLKKALREAVEIVEDKHEKAKKKAERRGTDMIKDNLKKVIDGMEDPERIDTLQKRLNDYIDEIRKKRQDRDD